jgi:pyridoxine/pyridoxamine 5'-phosphate oxidase
LKRTLKYVFFFGIVWASGNNWGIAQEPQIISDNYFDSRPEGSKLGAVVSNQSEVVPSLCISGRKFKKVRSRL